MVESQVPENPEFTDTMARLRALRKEARSGAEYWSAREIQEVLGYAHWRSFDEVVARARQSFLGNRVTPSHHIVEAVKMVGLGSDASRQVKDYYLSRAACYLVAMNGDPAKPQVAAAQAYFAVRTREAELQSTLSDDEKRLELREKVKNSHKAVSGVAAAAGVRSEKQASFHDARYQGLYGMSRRDVMSLKGLGSKENPFDRMGPLELSANDFQMNLASSTIQAEGLKGEARAISKNREIAKRVRKTMTDSGSVPPEELPTEEPIKQVERRVKAQKRLERKAKLIEE